MVIVLINDRANLQGEDKILKLLNIIAFNEFIPNSSALCGIDREQTPLASTIYANNIDDTVKRSLMHIFNIFVSCCLAVWQVVSDGISLISIYDDIGFS